MKQLFLYRLFKHSRTGFVLIALFLICYATSFYKKMDMIFFPYNSMYTIDFTKTNTTSTYAVKINNNPVKITNHLYWKKDFLETSLNAYCRYIKQDHKVFLDDYIAYKFKNKTVSDFLLNRLVPDKSTTLQWSAWYAHSAGYEVPPGAAIEFMQYDFLLENNNALLKDSLSIHKTIIP